MLKIKVTHLLAAIVLLVACNSNLKNDKVGQKLDSINSSNANQNNSETTSTSADTNTSMPNFVFNVKGDDANPSSEVLLDWNGKLTTLKSVSGTAELIAANDFKAKNIPETAIVACGAWWAGSGDYFYVINSVKGLEVYYGWQDEMDDKNEYHWEKFKEISK